MLRGARDATLEEIATIAFHKGGPIEETGLFGTKEVVALALCGVGAVGAFIALDLQVVGRLQGYGSATRQRLKKIQRKLRVTRIPVPVAEGTDV